MATKTVLSHKKVLGLVAVLGVIIWITLSLVPNPVVFWLLVWLATFSVFVHNIVEDFGWYRVVESTILAALVTLIMREILLRWVLRGLLS